MVSISDSDAIFDSDRMLIQHQAALTLLQGMLSNPDIDTIRWLDLACGKGQMICHLDRNLSEAQLTKLAFKGYDIDNSHTRIAKHTAESMDLKECNFQIGELSQFWCHADNDGPWDFISLTNALHEIKPSIIAELLARCVERLSDNGTLFVYDMESLPSPELGAINWTTGEIRRILTTLCRSLGSEHYEPAVGSWTHKTCTCWNVQIVRHHMKLPEGFRDKIPDAITTTEAAINSFLKTKHESVKLVLAGLTECDDRTDEDTDTMTRSLYELWALTRALEEDNA